MGEKMSENMKLIKPLNSEIINKKKQLILKVDQTSDFVYPNELYKYQIYCKNVSGDTIEDVHIQILNPTTISINEDDSIPPEGINIGDLNNGQSHLLYVKARCNTTGKFTVHFMCFGEESELVTKPLIILSDYDSYNDQTIHKIHIYNFTPYEEKFELHSRDYNNDVTQLIKKQKLPSKRTEKPFMISSEDINNNIIVDESQNYIDQANILYGDPYNSDEHNYQYIERENFNKESVESFEGENLKEIFDNINKYSKLFKATFLRTGSNELLNDFKQYSPDGFIYRFGLMNSEIFHHIGVIPEYSYMNDNLFRWASEGKTPLNLYPARLDMEWDKNKWAGHGWNVWKIYTDEYKEQIIDNDDYSPCFEFIQNFEDIDTAKQYIQNEYDYDTSNEYYINTKNGIEKIRKYQYIIKESYYDNGVFFVHIPLSKIPSNFFLLDTEDIEAIVEKTKPYGMKALIRYIIDTKFDIKMSFKPYIKLKPHTKIDFGEEVPISFSITPYRHNNIIETVCIKNGSTKSYKERKTLKLIPDGVGFYNSARFNIEPNLSFLPPDPKSLFDMDMTPELSKSTYQCEPVNRLLYLSEVRDLLYKGNFEEISFYTNNIALATIPQTNADINFDKISAVNYKLWKDSLFDSQGRKNVNPHSYWWDLDISKNPLKNIYYYNLSNTTTKIDFVEIPLISVELKSEGIESGIGFQDTSGKLHGISAEYNEDIDSFIVKYITSLNNNFKIKKQGLSNITGLAYHFSYKDGNTLITFLLKQEDENNQTKYHYFDHVIVNQIQSIFCFTRNDKDILSIRSWGDLLKIGKNTNPKIVFNTPKYHKLNTYDPVNIIDSDKTNWTNITKIDKNEHSYAVIQNLSNEEIDVDDITLHFDNVSIPDDAIVKDIRIKSILESNSYKNIYSLIRLQDGFITENSDANNISCYPNDIECYPIYNNNTKYYENQYSEAKINESNDSIKLFEQKITENELFNDSLDYSTDYIDDPDSFITVKKPFWVELSNFSDYNISMNDISDIKFCIEGYNDGKEVWLISQLKQDNTFSEKKRTLIPSGYFKKYISLNYYNKFMLNGAELRFRFSDLNADLNIFDTYIDVELKKKQKEPKEFDFIEEYEIEKKKEVGISLIDKKIPGYILKNGFTAQLKFDSIDSGEYYRIYSIELEVIYQKQNINLLINPESFGVIDTENSLTVVGGKTSENYVGGMFFNELIMPGTYQSKSTTNSKNQGIELRDALYQSFVATADNMTSVTFYPNGFVGSPDINLKISLYDNKSNTPNKIIKEVRVNGWSKENVQLKNATMITYDFNVNNLKIGEKYWIKIEVDNVIDGSYYLLKYTDASINNLKLLTRINNNLINTFGALKFHVNTLNAFRSFKNLPISEDDPNFSDPKIFIGLNKRVGEAQNIQIQKSNG